MLITRIFKFLLFTFIIIIITKCGFYKSEDGVYSTADFEEWDNVYLLNGSLENGLSKPPKRWITQLPGTYNSRPIGGEYVYYHNPKYWNHCNRGFGVYLLGQKQYPFTRKPIAVNDGYYCIGMVKTNHGENSRIRQKLSTKMLPKARYEMYINLAYQEDFKHPHDTISKEAFCADVPPILKIWSADEECDLYELLFESNQITNTTWKRMKIEFSPLDTVRNIVFEVDYSIKNANSTNLLIDDISMMKLVSFLD